MNDSHIVASEAGLIQSVQHELFTGTREHHIGLEVEVFLQPMEGSQNGRSDSVVRLMESIARDLGGEYTIDDHRGPRVVLPSGAVLTLEPAGQLEYSGVPFREVEEAVATALSCIHTLRDHLRARGWRMWHGGFDTHAGEGPLVVSKSRYVAMDAYFQRIGPYGRMMMRRTCALQINLDFGPTEIAQERWRLANMMAPALNALFANSSHAHGGRSYSSFRYEVWRRTDPSRTGPLLDRPDLDPVRDYTRFALDAMVMMVETDAGTVVPEPGLTFRQWMTDGWCGRFPRYGDWRRHLSTLFPDVRPKGWIEIRSIDAQSPDMTGPVAAVVRALLYDDGVRRSALAMLENRTRSMATGEEHGGYWTADLSAGIDLLHLALDAVGHPRYRRRLALHLTSPATHLGPRIASMNCTRNPKL